jgi:hypothetical protein
MNQEQQYSDFIIYVDESGDHGMENISSGYPMFVLTFCIFEKQTYYHQIIPTIMDFKSAFWGHGEVVLHEHDIRKPKGDFTILFNRHIREVFMNKLNQLMKATPCTLIASVIDKLKFRDQYSCPANPYEMSLSFGLERLYRFLKDKDQHNRETPVIVEMRGKREDNDLELAFRRICDGVNYFNAPLPFKLVMVDKKSNAAGLQIADLMARPIGIKLLRPTQPNRAYDILEQKFRKSSSGVVNGWGLKIFP